VFGDRGQALLAAQKVGVIGAGGAGSLVVEYLARLGVGHLVVVDPERIETTNLPRVVGGRRRDAWPWLTHPDRPPIMRALGERLSIPKVKIAERVCNQLISPARLQDEALTPDHRRQQRATSSTTRSPRPA
jgi:molybdopterin/thiamine biosynthesis adenylyltransferase